MAWALFTILLALCTGMIASGLRRRDGIYGYPLLAGTTFLGFAAPQIPALIADAYLPDGAVAKALFVTVLCAGASWAGWSVGMRAAPVLHWDLDRRRAVGIALILTLAGAVFYYKLSGLPEQVLSSSLYTGLPVAYLFFAKLLSYGLYLGVLCFVRWRSKAALAIAAVGAALLLHRVVVGGRRGEFTEFVLVIVLSAWFARRVAVPRAIALTGFLLGALALNSTGDYRAATKSEDGPKWSEVAKIDVAKNFTDLLENGGPEMRNAVLRINDVDRRMAFDFGLFHWNTLVFNFVPAQIVGSAVKESLLVEGPEQAGRDYAPPTGSTETGMADAFASFWYLGSLKFFAIAYALGRLYRSAMEGAMTAQIVYMVSIVAGMLAITHHTQWVVSTWAHVALMLLPWLAWARVKSHRLRADSRLAATPPIPEMSLTRVDHGPGRW